MRCEFDSRIPLITRKPDFSATILLRYILIRSEVVEYTHHLTNTAASPSAWHWGRIAAGKLEQKPLVV